MKKKLYLKIKNYLLQIIMKNENLKVFRESHIVLLINSNNKKIFFVEIFGQKLKTKPFKN